MCEEKKSTVVKPAFEKYDKDGNGFIDSEELANLSADLGHPLNDEQVEAALGSLDINRDGVIDYNEFCRWYFTGMRSYSGSEVTMFKFKNGAAMLGDTIANPELVAAINANKSTVTQSVSCSFNAPENPQTEVNARVNFFGPETAKWTQKGKDFRASKGVDLPKDGDAMVYFKAELSNRTPEEFNALKEHVTSILEGETTLGQHLKMWQIAMDLEHTGSKMIVQFSIMPPEKIPGSWNETIQALAEVQNSVNFNVQLATSPGEIMKSEKTISECLLGGFKAQTDLTYLKNVK